MDWKHLIAEIRARDVTLELIRSECGFSSRGHVLDVQNGRLATVRWEVGDKLIRMHKRVTREAKATQ